MTNRTKLILFVLGSLLVGAAAGGVTGSYVAIYFTSGYFSDGWMLGNSVDTQINISILKNLRNGDTEKAVEFLETTLDEKIISLQISDENTQWTNKSVSKAIRVAIEYRNEYPRHTENPDVDKMVSEALSKNGN